MVVSRLSLVSRQRVVLGNNQTNLGRVVELQDRLSSGKRVAQVSDDPISGRRALLFRLEQQRGEGYLRNVERSLTSLEAVDSTFGEISSVLESVKEAAVQGADSSADSAARAALASSVQAQLDRILDLANTVHDGRSVFAGTVVDDKPFALNEAGDRVLYSGNQDTYAVRISNFETVTVNDPGDQVFQGDTDVFQTLIDLKDALLDDDGQRVSSVLDDLHLAQDQIVARHGQIGGRVQRLELAQRQLEISDVQLQDLISQETDADLAETILDLQSAQLALEAGLQAGARVLQPTLLDFL
jgi:flagellar hook-associated protein 3 FlgL